MHNITTYFARLVIILMITIEAMGIIHAEVNIPPIKVERSQFIGYAYDLETNNLLYTEHHNYQTPFKHTVDYREPNGQLFATKQLDYNESFYAPNFIQKNMRNGETIRSKKDNQKIMIQYQENSTSEYEKESISFSKNLIIDAGFNQFITKNWQLLIEGKEMTIDYLIPSLLDHYELSIKKEPCEKVDTYCFSISASSFFISLFSSTLKLTYSPNRDLLAFQGRSNICDTDGNYQDVKITYQYDTL